LHLVFIGAPGSGKGTQAEKFKSEHGYKHVSTGDLLRLEVSKETSLGLKIDDIISNGSLVDDETVLELFKSNLDMSDFHYIIDGFPRTLNQCKLLNEHVLDGHAYRAIYFKVNEDRLVERVVNRRIATGSGRIYNLLTDPPAVDGICDISGEALIHREDDKEDVVLKRLEVYNKSIEDILKYYSDRGRLVTLDASKPLEVVYLELSGVII